MCKDSSIFKSHHYKFLFLTKGISFWTNFSLRCTKINLSPGEPSAEGKGNQFLHC